ncbi:MAG: PepSY domain-containing protein [Parahaliea sp.]
MSADDQRNVREAVSSGRYKPLTEILLIVEQQVPGRLLEVELVNDRLYGAVYEVEVLDARQRKREVLVDARSGAIVELDEAPVVGGLMPLPALLRQLAERFPGYIEDVELENGGGGRMVYELKLVQDNARRMDLVVDAGSGEIVDSVPNLLNEMQHMQSLPEILERALTKHPGVVLEAELERHRHSAGDQDWYYDIEIRLENGSTRELHIDAASGQVLREKTIE